MDIQVGAPGVPPISQKDKEGEEMTPANKLPTPIPEELVGRPASELDIPMFTVEEQANELDAASATSEKPTDELAILMATVRKPAGEPDTSYPMSGGNKEGEGSKLQLPQLDKGDTCHMANNPSQMGPSDSG